MRLVGFSLVLAAATLLAGCRAEAPRQAGARVAVEESLAASSEYDGDKTRCTANPSPWFIEREADVFICVARRRAGGCDWYRATLKNAGWDVALDRRNTDCLVPF